MKKQKVSKRLLKNNKGLGTKPRGEGDMWGIVLAWLFTLLFLLIIAAYWKGGR